MSSVLLVGAGPMAVAYHAAITATHPQMSISVVGRGQESAQRFATRTGVMPTTGALSDQLAQLNPEVRSAIVAVQVDQLLSVTQQLLEHGFERILLEKPGAPTVAAATQLAHLDPSDRILIAYNRRFLPSAKLVRDAVRAEGGVRSFSFEFTEVDERVRATGHSPIVKANWALANSSHVMDLAFDLAGAAEDLSDVSVAAALGRGELDWHPRGSRFAGCGCVNGGTLFSYSADWGSGGGWGIEIATPSHRYIMRPLETVVVQSKGSFARAQIEVPADIDGIKPGLPAMLHYFFSDRRSDGSLPTARQQAGRLALFDSLLGEKTSNRAELPPRLFAE